MTGKTEDVKKFSNGAEYRLAGECQVCGKKVYQCVTHPIRDAGTDKTDVAVFVPQGTSGELGIFCLAHDPYISHKRMIGRSSDQPIHGDSWTPLK